MTEEERKREEISSAFRSASFAFFLGIIIAIFLSSFLIWLIHKLICWIFKKEGRTLKNWWLFSFFFSDKDVKLEEKSKEEKKGSISSMLDWKDVRLEEKDKEILVEIVKKFRKTSDLKELERFVMGFEGKLTPGGEKVLREVVYLSFIEKFSKWFLRKDLDPEVRKIILKRIMETWRRINYKQLNDFLTSVLKEKFDKLPPEIQPSMVQGFLERFKVDFSSLGYDPESIYKGVREYNNLIIDTLKPQKKILSSLKSFKGLLRKKANV